MGSPINQMAHDVTAGRTSADVRKPHAPVEVFLLLPALLGDGAIPAGLISERDALAWTVGRAPGGRHLSLCLFNPGPPWWLLGRPARGKSAPCTREGASWPSWGLVVRGEPGAALPVRAAVGHLQQSLEGTSHLLANRRGAFRAPRLQGLAVDGFRQPPFLHNLRKADGVEQDDPGGMSHAKASSR